MLLVFLSLSEFVDDPSSLLYMLIIPICDLLGKINKKHMIGIEQCTKNLKEKKRGKDETKHE